jgi:PadR family transcriptional regulator, regulatory protein PadR
MPTSTQIEQWSTQLRKGLAELCVLAAVNRLGEAYGYQLVQFLTDHDGLTLTESTIYPLLARLAREGQLSVTSAASPSGPPRRYYRITAAGRRSLESMLQHWTAVGTSIKRIICNGSTQEKKS